MEDFSIDRRQKSGRNPYCKNCINKYCAERGQIPEIRGKRNETSRLKRERIKIETMNAYGGKCKCCNESRTQFLTIEHLNSDGKEDRKNVGSGVCIYYWLKRNGFPKDNYTCLCINCNFSRGMYGYCPHDFEKIFNKTNEPIIPFLLLEFIGNKCIMKRNN